MPTIRKHHNSIKSIALIIVLTLILAKVTDLVLLKYLPQSAYLFPPNSKALYKTREFDALVSINRFGFRGNETELTEGQILVIGDSFTFGWGLKDEEVWARVLEKQLKSSGLDLKVYNLGVPGTDPYFHLEVAETYVRQLKPKFVVISVLISDDFQQVLEKRADNPAPSYWGTIFKSAVLKLKNEFFPGLYRFYVAARYFNFRTPVKPGPFGGNFSDQAIFPITQSWGEESLTIVRDKKLHLPNDILERATAGDINPFFFSMVSRHPNREWAFWDRVENNSAERDVLAEMTKKFSEISSLIKSFGGKLIVVSLPSGSFVDSEARKNYGKYGLKMNEDSLVTYKPEVILGQMAKSSDALFISSLAEFREHRGAELFFPLDGHPSPEGSMLVANKIGKVLLSQAGFR